MRSGQIQARDTQGFFAPLHHAWWKVADEHTESGELTAGGTPDAVIEGMRISLSGRGRSMVAIHLSDASAFEPFMDTFMDVQQSSDVSGSVSVLHGTSFSPSASAQRFIMWAWCHGGRDGGFGSGRFRG